MATALIEQGIIKILRDQNVAEKAVFGGIAPEDQRAPFVTYQRISGIKWRAINGPSGLAQATFQIDMYERAYADCRLLADQIRKILDGFRGTVTIGSDTVRIAGCSLVGEREFIEDNTDPKLYRASVDYLFTFEEDL